jgi:superfamily II DNA/RNA helicase
MKLLTLIPNARVAVVMQMVIGGTNINRERSGLSGSRCDLLIATPGRLQDHLDSTQGCVGRCGACRWAGDSRPSFHL